MDVFQFFQGIYTFFLVSPLEAGARVFLILLGFLFCYLGYRKTLEPLLMIPMGIGMLGVNGGLLIFSGGNIGTLFVDPMASNAELLNVLQINFLQPIYTLTFSNGLIACLVFMGIGDYRNRFPYCQTLPEFIPGCVCRIRYDFHITYRDGNGVNCPSIGGYIPGRWG
jgi:Na+-transporting methylmalonyl-CoA/oxaloacetate decarboxylase beta subunit